MGGDWEKEQEQDLLQQQELGQEQEQELKQEQSDKHMKRAVHAIKEIFCGISCTDTSQRHNMLHKLPLASDSILVYVHTGTRIFSKSPQTIVCTCQ